MTAARFFYRRQFLPRLAAIIVCRALGDNVTLIAQRQPLDDPARLSADDVLRAVEHAAAA